MKGYCRSIEILGLMLMLGLPVRAGAQASGEAGGDIELGANQASEIEMSAGASGSAEADDSASRPSVRSGGDNDTRLALQLRLDAVNTLRFAEPDNISASLGERLLVPIVTPGVRLLDDGALFLGLGFGFASYDGPAGPADELSRSGFSITPLGTYDLLRDDSAALSLLAAINIGSLGETEQCNNTPTGQACTQQDNDEFGFGIDLGVGIRGLISNGLALGAEFGWGFLSRSADPDEDTFEHAVFGNLLLEASVGL